MRKCYDYIISIGLNCEIRYQLRKKFGAIESSLLEWAAIYPQHLIDVLKNPNLIFSEQIEELLTFVQNVSETICKIAKNASLLIIVSQDDFNTINILDNDKNLFIRQVKHFSPYNKATSPEYVDLESGDKIFSEFVLKEQKVDNKIYKFEKECAI